MEEIWKDIEGYEGLYQVSNLGRVKSKRGILKPNKGNHGYHTVALCKKSKCTTTLLHRLVAESFILNQENKREVNHIDGNKLNNSIYNLEWNTSKENKIHAYNTGLQDNRGIKHINSKLSEDDVLNIRQSNLSQRKLAKIYNVSQTLIFLVKNNITYKNI